MVSTTPFLDYDLIRTNPKEFLLKPKELLSPNFVYNVLISTDEYAPPLSWAFQTKDSFVVRSVFPSDGGTFVPVDTGIEIRFSQPIEKSVSDSFTISPTVRGSFTVDEDKTLIFMPAEKLQPNCEYEIRLDADTLQSQVGDKLGEDYVFRFTTSQIYDQKESAWIYEYDKKWDNITSTEPVYIAFHADLAFQDVDFKTAVYRIPDAEAYLSALKDTFLNGAVEVIKLNGLEKIYDFSSKLTYTDPNSSWSASYIELPENPDKGYYVVDIRTKSSDSDLNDRHMQRLLQISDISVYKTDTFNNVMFWLNNAKTGDPVQDAVISYGSTSGNTDREGMAVLRRSSEDREAVWDRDSYNSDRYFKLSIHAGDNEYTDYIEKPYWYRWGSSDLYYTYVYTDRELYQPTDKVHFWGLVLPRGEGTPPPSIFLDFKGDGRYPEGLTVKVDPNGSFEGEISFENLVSGWEPLYFKLNGEDLMYKGINVMEYEKPVYTLEHKVDKDYYRKGDSIRFQLEGGFFDGTPAEGLSLSASINRNSDNSTSDMILDQNGFAEAYFKVGGSTDWRPYHASIYYITTGAESVDLYGNASAYVFPSNYMLKTSADRSGDNSSSIVISTDGYSVNFDNISKNDYSYMKDDYKALEGAVAEFSGTAVLWETEYIKEKNGSYYDYKNKKVVETYQYTTQEHRMQTTSLSSENGKAEFEFQGYPEAENKHYRVEFDCLFPDGSRLLETTYVSNSNFRSYQRYRWGEYYSVRVSNLDDKNYNDYSDYGYMIKSYGLGEEVSLELVDGDRNQPVSGRMIYAVIGNGTFDSTVNEKNRFEFNFPYSPKYAPDVAVVCAYFDGVHIYKANPLELRYRYEDSELSLSVKPGKASYNPGEEFSARISISNREGQPLAANYLISIADEAAFAVFDQNAKPLEETYHMLYPWYSEYVSYRPFFQENGGAEMGDGGGDDAVRREFVDTVAFIQGKTDETGSGEIRVKLPDNLTSWRITSIAFLDDFNEGVNIPKIGKSVNNFSVSLPYFINAVTNSRYIEGDSIGLTIRSAGTAINSDTNVSYELNLKGEGVNINKSVKGRAGDFLPADFGELKQGSYKLLIKGSGAGHTDALEKEITVTDSLLNQRRQISKDLSEGIDIKPVRFPVDLYFYDIENELFYDISYRLFYSYGDRADQKLGRAISSKKLQAVSEYFNEDLAVQPDPDELRQWSRGMRLWPYAEDDPLLTAKFALTAGEYLDREALIDYFWSVINNTETEALNVAAAYMGLGALKAPVLYDLRRLVNDNDSFDFRQRQLIAIGLAAIGDRENAFSWYNERFGENSKVSERDDEKRRITLDRDGQYISIDSRVKEYYRLTADTAMLTAIIGHEDATGFMSYLLGFDYYNYDPVPELAVWICLYSPRPTQCSFSYYQGNDLVSTFDFADTRVYNLKLGEEQLALARFEIGKGRVGYQANYIGGLDINENEAHPLAGVKIDRSLNTDTVKLGGELEVMTEISFDKEAVVGYYQVNTVLPSGFRLVSVNAYTVSGEKDTWNSAVEYRVGESGNLSYYICPVYPDGSRWSYDYYDVMLRSMPEKVWITYTARAVLPGDFVVESDTYAAEWSNKLYHTKRDRVKVI
jgi:hypothetical protein